jgi:hypothetical protein
MRSFIGPMTAVLAVAATLAVFSFKVRADSSGDVETFTVDVAQDSATNAQNDIVRKEGNNPALFSRGDTFILDGTIYPAGSLPSGQADNDPNAPGGMGKYRLRGTYTTDNKSFEQAIKDKPNVTPVMAFATEVFSFPDDGTTILTDGIWPNAHFTANRQVLGGTGRFQYVVGQITEQNIGENKTGFCNLRVTFTLKRVTTP